MNIKITTQKNMNALIGKTVLEKLRESNVTSCSVLTHSSQIFRRSDVNEDELLKLKFKVISNQEDEKSLLRLLNTLQGYVDKGYSLDDVAKQTGVTPAILLNYKDAKTTETFKFLANNKLFQDLTTFFVVSTEEAKELNIELGMQNANIIKVEKMLHASRISRSIVMSASSIISPLLYDATINGLANVIVSMSELEKVQIDSDIEYFDINLVLVAVMAADEALITKSCINTVQIKMSDIIDVVMLAANNQVEKWLVDLAECTETHKYETIRRLEFLFEQGQKISRIRNHNDFHFLAGFLAGVEQEKGQAA